LVRCDLNVSLDEKKEIKNDLRIREALPTIDYLARNGAKVVLISHFAEPEEKKDMEEKERTEVGKGTILPIKERISKLMGRRDIRFVPDCIGEGVEKEVKGLKEGDILLLENVRIYKEEKDNSEEFGRELSKLGDIFVNDAFSVSHRAHASVARIPSFIPSVTGMLFEKEKKILDRVQRAPKRPIVAIIGGAKVESKIPAVNFFLEKSDHVLLGGKIANALLAARGIALDLPAPKDGLMDTIKKMDYTSPRLHLPVDVITSYDNEGRSGLKETAPGKIGKEKDVFDIGSETRKLYGNIIRQAGTIIWAGPLGLSEKEPFKKGTEEVGRMVAENKKALKVVGGGDTGEALMRFGFLKEMDLVSCGGGAMLTYLSGGRMPGIEALKAS